MALPGPAPKPGKVGRTPNADWQDVDDVPFEAGRSRELPTRIGVETTEDGKDLFTEAGWSAQTEAWWDVVRTLPHAVLWTEADWMFAADTAYLKERFYLGAANAAEMTEMRRREDLLGLSSEARRKNRIRYNPVEPALGSEEAAQEATAENVTPIRRQGGARRRRALED